MKCVANGYLGIALALVLFSNIAMAENCNLKAGKEAFSACSTCHSVDKNGTHLLGPNLRGIVGSESGNAEDFYYSPAFEDLEFEWTPERLSEFLKNPMKNVPGTFMAFGGIKNEQQRQDLICYLQQLE